MGYCAYIMEQDITIKGSEKPKMLNKFRHPSAISPTHYGWVNPQELAQAESLQEAWNALGFWFSESTDDINYIEFGGEKLSDDHVVFSNIIAPHVEPGSWVEWQGEDGERWRWEFNGKTVRENRACVMYEDDGWLESAYEERSEA